MNIKQFFALYDRVVDAPDAIPRLRRFVLDLAVRGKLVEQDPADEPASELLDRARTKKQLLIEERQIRRGAPPEHSVSAGEEESPDHWCWAYLHDFAIVLGGKRLPAGTSFSKEPTGYIYIRVTDMKNGTISCDGLKFISAKIKAKITKYTINKDDLYVTIAGTIGAVGDVPELFDGHNLTENAAKVVFREIDRTFLKLALQSQDVQDQFAEKTKQMAQPKLALKRISGARVPIPPLAEQRRIVVKVDELMTLCDQLEEARTAREATRNRFSKASYARLIAPDMDAVTFRSYARFACDALPALTARADQVKQLRQTILDLAVRGKLVEQDPADEPADELLKQVAEQKTRLEIPYNVKPLTTDETPFSLPKDWLWSRIGELCTKTGSGSTPRGGKSVYKRFGVPFLRSQNVYDDGLRLDNVAYIAPGVHAQMAGTAVRAGDLLLNITGGSMGRCCRVPDNFSDANVSQHVSIVRLAVPEMSYFIHKLILSPYFQGFIFDEQTGAGRGGLPKKKLDRIMVAVPPISEQRRIVAKVDELMTLCDRLEANLDIVDVNRRHLFESLLRNALKPSFGVELTS